MICKLCGEKMTSRGSLSMDVYPPIHNDRYDCPNGHRLWISYSEDTPRSETWFDERGNEVTPPPAPDQEASA